MNFIQQPTTIEDRRTRGPVPNDLDKLFRAKSCYASSSLQLGGTTRRYRKDTNMVDIKKFIPPSCPGGCKFAPREVPTKSVRTPQFTPTIISPSSSLGGSKGVPREVRKNTSSNRKKSTPIILPSSSLGESKGVPREVYIESLRRMKSTPQRLPSPSLGRSRILPRERNNTSSRRMKSWSTLSLSLSRATHTSRVQQRRRSLTTVHAGSCYRVQEFFEIKDVNILNELSDMEKPTNKTRSLAEDGGQISLADLAGSISTQTTSAIERGAFNSSCESSSGLAREQTAQSYTDSFRYIEEHATPTSLMLAI